MVHGYKRDREGYVYEMYYLSRETVVIIVFNWLMCRLYQKYQDDTTEGVLYKMLLHSLGVADLPKELTAVSSTFSLRENQQAEEKKPMDLPER